MVDISTDLPRWGSPISGYHRLTGYRWFLVAVLAVGCWTAVAEINQGSMQKTARSSGCPAQARFVLLELPVHEAIVGFQCPLQFGARNTVGADLGSPRRLCA